MQNTQGTAKRRPGRPKKDPSEVKRHQVNIAMAEPIRRAIGEAAERNGRSVSSEIDYRLGMSLELDKDTGSAPVRRLLDFTRLAALKLAEEAGKDWPDDAMVATKLASSITSYIGTNTPGWAELYNTTYDAELIELQRQLDEADGPEASLAAFKLAERIKERREAFWAIYREAHKTTQKLMDLFQIKQPEKGRQHG